MPVEVLNPEGLSKPDMYRQVSIATGSRLVFIAGQVARDADGNAVGVGDLAAQTEQAFATSPSPSRRSAEASLTSPS